MTVLNEAYLTKLILYSERTTTFINVYQLPYQSYTEVLYYIATQIAGDTIALGDFNTYYPN